MTAPPRILILSVPNGAAHQRAAVALQKALTSLHPCLHAEVVDAIAHCTAWFRAYYGSYVIPLSLWPGLWRWIESKQYQGESTGPGWLYRRGAQPLFRFLRNSAPDAVIATEVGALELAALYKRESNARFALVGVELMDFNRAWIQPEVDLLLTSNEDMAAELVSAGAPASKVAVTGQPVDPAYASLPTRAEARAKLGLKPDAVQILVALGSQGLGKPELILGEILKVPHPVEVTVIAGRNRKVETRLRKRYQGVPQVRVQGWVNNLQEWMAASDLMISKPGGATLNEGFACGLPLLAFNPFPGNEERTCRWMERRGAGVWIKKTEDLIPTLAHLLNKPGQLDALRARVRRFARPQSARESALAVMKLLDIGPNAESPGSR